MSFLSCIGLPLANALVLALASLLCACGTTPSSTPRVSGQVTVERSAGMTTWATAESLHAEATAARATAAARAQQRLPAADAPAIPASSTSAAGAAAATGMAPLAVEVGAEVPIERVVYFDFDRDDIRQEFQPMIERRARALLAAGGRRLVLEGHADERGSREYNLSLGQRRAEAVKRALTLLGVPEMQLEAISFGDTRPAVEGSNERVWSQNRRVELKAP